jgi:hypothetical protein
MRPRSSGYSHAALVRFRPHFPMGLPSVCMLQWGLLLPPRAGVLAASQPAKLAAAAAAAAAAAVAGGI